LAFKTDVPDPRSNWLRRDRLIEFQQQSAGEGRLTCQSMTARGGDRMQPVVAEHMRHETLSSEYFRKRVIANA
jgi:hypothetical protein